jgi:HlyD family secretion protein
VLSVPVELPLMGKITKSKSWIIAAATIGIVGFSAGTFAWVRHHNAPIDLTPYTIAVKAEPFTLRITASGTVVPFQSVNISPKNAGILEKLLVEQGDRVEAGQLLARMDQRDVKGQLLQAQAAVEQARAKLARSQNGSRTEEIDQAKARVNQAKAQLDTLRNGSRVQDIAQARAQVTAAQARLDLAKAKEKQYTELVRSGAISQERYNEVMTEARTAAATLAEIQQRLALQNQGPRSEEIERAKASLSEATAAYNLVKNGSRPEDIRQAKADVAAATGQLQVAQARLDDTVIQAPFTGIVTQKYATEGAFVTPTTSASSTAAATSTSIVALAKGLEILAKVPEVDIGQIRQGQSVEIRVDAYPDKVFQGRVRLISPEAIVEQNVTSFQVRVSVLTGQRQLLSGMNTDLTFLGRTVKDKMVIPTVAIATLKGQTGVYIPDKENKPKFQPITVGSSVKDKSQVLEGLTPQQKVFIDFPKQLKPKEMEETRN